MAPRFGFTWFVVCHIIVTYILVLCVPGPTALLYFWGWLPAGMFMVFATNLFSNTTNERTSLILIMVAWFGIIVAGNFLPLTWEIVGVFAADRQSIATNLRLSLELLETMVMAVAITIVWSIDRVVAYARGIPSRQRR